jgi:hypothetical protein
MFTHSYRNESWQVCDDLKGIANDAKVDSIVMYV